VVDRPDHLMHFENGLPVRPAGYLVGEPTVDERRHRDHVGHIPSNRRQKSFFLGQGISFSFWG